MIPEASQKISSFLELSRSELIIGKSMPSSLVMNKSLKSKVKKKTYSFDQLYKELVSCI